jgi:nucleoid-associated protein YgaU
VRTSNPPATPGAPETRQITAGRAAAALAAATVAGIALTASPAAADTAAPSPTTASTWKVIHPTYQDQQPDVTLPPPAPSPTTPNPFGRAPVVQAAATTRAAAHQQVEHPMALWTVTAQRRLPQVTVHTTAEHHAAPPIHVRHHTAAKRTGNLLPPHRAHRPVVHHHIGRWTVAPGETLSGIARATGHTKAALLAANRHLIRHPDHIEAGWVLHIPAATT